MTAPNQTKCDAPFCTHCGHGTLSLRHHHKTLTVQKIRHGDFVPPPLGNDRMSTTEKIHAAGKSIAGIAKVLGVQAVDVRHCAHGRPRKVGRNRRKSILAYFRSQNWLPTPIPRPRHECPLCHKVHVIKSEKKSVRVSTQGAERTQ